MAASTSGKNRPKIDEQSICQILTQFTADTILILLQEIANYPENKINWNDIAIKLNNRVANTYTPLELKRLWRHLAYGKPLIKNMDKKDGIKVEKDYYGDDDDDNDDSDLEIELEVNTSLNCDDGPILKEAVNCVKKFASKTVVEITGKKIKEKNVQK